MVLFRRMEVGELGTVGLVCLPAVRGRFVEPAREQRLRQLVSEPFVFAESDRLHEIQIHQ